MIPFHLVTGFLGSGKTTLLARIARLRPNRRFVYLVNDFSDLDVDSRRLASADSEVISVAGGSIFCRCLVTEFLGQLDRIANEIDRPDAPVEALVVEASGVADPRVTRRMLEETGRDRHFELKQIITIIDPGSFFKLLHTLPSVRRQVEAADLAILNKIDLYDEETLGAAEREILAIHPGIRLDRACRCDVELDFADGPTARRLEGDYATCADPHFASFSARPRDDLDARSLRGALALLADDVYRVKGRARIDGRWTEVDFASGSLSLAPAGSSMESDETDRGELVVIARAAGADRVRDFVEAMRSGDLRR